MLASGRRLEADEVAANDLGLALCESDLGDASIHGEELQQEPSSIPRGQWLNDQITHRKPPSLVHLRDARLWTATRQGSSHCKAHGPHPPRRLRNMLDRRRSPASAMDDVLPFLEQLAVAGRVEGEAARRDHDPAWLIGRPRATQAAGTRR